MPVIVKVQLKTMQAHESDLQYFEMTYRKLGRNSDLNRPTEST